MRVSAAFGRGRENHARKTGYKMLKSAPWLLVADDIGAAAGQKGQEGLKESA
jgi:hypothetical protein